MTRDDFEELRKLPGKFVSANINWGSENGMGPNLSFRDVHVFNTLGQPVILNGTYKPLLRAVTFNFVLRGTGPVCRVDVNGTIHRAAGRTHKHELRDPQDPEANLPEAYPRPDLVGRSAREVWEILCAQANINHIGKFTDP